MHNERILLSSLFDKIMTAEKAASLIQDGMSVGSSGFTKAGDSKAVLAALAKKSRHEPTKISLVTGASLGYDVDGLLAKSHTLARRFPFQAAPELRKAINQGEVMYMDQHLSETAELLHNKHLPHIDIAILEIAGIEADGSIIPTTSVGNSATLAALAKKVILEINTTVPLSIKNFHDIVLPGEYPNRQPIPIISVDTRIGNSSIPLNPEKVIGIVITETADSPATINEPEVKTDAIASHLIRFLEEEVVRGTLPKNLLPLQAGIGKVANAVLGGLINSNFQHLTMYSEVLQDSTFDLINAGKMDFASASSITVSQSYLEEFMTQPDKYRNKVLLRPQNISNSAEVIRRLGVIAINTAIEADIYGNINSTHISGTHMMNGIGGSGDFSRNAYLSIFVTQAASKNDNISHIVPMVSHVDHSEHDVDILVTDYGLADLRGLAPRERAKKIIENCCHPEYREQLNSYYQEALQRGGHTPHVLEKAFAWHTRLRDIGSMKEQIAEMA